MNGYSYIEHTFKYPKLTRTAKNPRDLCIFMDCDFRAISNIRLSGFEKVVFEGWRQFFRPGVRIEIKDCKNFEFRKADFYDNEISLHITGADSIKMMEVAHLRSMNIQIENSDNFILRNSTLCFNTSNINVKYLWLGGSQIDLKELDLTGVSEKLAVTSANVFDVQQMLIRPGIKLVIETCSQDKQKLQSVIRYQGR